MCNFKHFCWPLATEMIYVRNIPKGTELKVMGEKKKKTRHAPINTHCISNHPPHSRSYVGILSLRSHTRFSNTCPLVSGRLIPASLLKVSSSRTRRVLPRSHPVRRQNPGSSHPHQVIRPKCCGFSWVTGNSYTRATRKQGSLSKALQYLRSSCCKVPCIPSI